MRIFTRIFVLLLFLSGLVAVLYFTLVPNIRGRMFYALPRPIAYWCGMHDDLANLAAFALLGTLGFWTSRGFAARRELVRRIWLFAMLGLVCILEFAQLGIQGRDSSMWDVVVGWAGVLGAWFVCAAIERRACKQPPE